MEKYTFSELPDGWKFMLRPRYDVQTLFEKRGEYKAIVIFDTTGKYTKGQLVRFDDCQVVYR